MVFVQMALRNVSRNWNRTGMIILSMMVASALMTVTMALSTGYSEGSNLPWRQLVGADVLVYPDQYVFAGGGDPSAVMEWRRLDPEAPTDALFFNPSLERGYLSPGGAGPAVFDLADLPAALDGLAGVNVEPARIVRAYLVVEKEDGESVRLPVTVRGRDIADDVARWDLPSTVVSGRYFREDQDGDWVAVANQAGLLAAAERAGLPASELPKTGGRLVLEVPAVRGQDPSGNPVLDFSQVQSFYFMLYGQVALSLGEVRLENAADPNQIDAGGQSGGAPMWPVFVDEPEIWLPAATFDAVYAEVAGGAFRYAGQLNLILDDMFTARTLAGELAVALPGYSVLTVPQQVALAGINYRARVETHVPFKVSVTRSYYGRPSLSMDVKSDLSYLAFAVAGLLVVANMFILVTQRRREIGILKAVGAGSRDILTLFVVEALGYSVIGSLLGFLGVRLLTLVSLFGSPTSLVEGARLTFQACGTIVGLTVATAVVFGFLPAWEAARTPSATLLGDF